MARSGYSLRADMFRKISAGLLGFLFICSIASAQEIAKNQIFTLDDFSGGLVTKASPFTLKKNQASICENVRFSDTYKALSKRGQTLLYGTADSTEEITGMHRLYLKDGTKVLLVNHGDEIETGSDITGAFTKILDLSTGDYRWQWATWHNVAIGTDGYNQPVKYDGTSASATYIGSCLAADAGDGSGPSGTYHYKITFYTTSYEVAFNVASNAVTVTDNDIDLTMIPIGPDNYGGEEVIGRKIYRHKNGATTYYLLTNGEIANNSDVTLTDSDSDGEISATTYPTTYTCTPPKGKLALIHYNRLFLGNDPSAPSRLYYTDDGNLDYFIPTDYYWDVRPNDGDQIMFIKVFLGLMVVGKENSILKFYTDGSSPAADWSLSDIFTRAGCRGMYSAQETPTGIIYLGSDGLYRFNGQAAELISDRVEPEMKDILESNRPYAWGIFHKNKYYLAYSSKKTSSSENNRILIYDFIGENYSVDILNANCFVSFSSGSDWDALYYGSSSDGKVYNYTYQAYEIYHHKHSDFTGTFTDARYIPEAVGGDANNPEIEIARTETIDDLTGTIDEMIGSIDRDSLTGSYISQALNAGAQKYDKIYWTESFGTGTDNITLAIRSASTEAGLSAASWSSEYSDPSGSDISALTAGAWCQYRISLTTSDYDHSPILSDGVKISYFKEATTTETTIPLHWRSGWYDFLAGYKKTLRKIQVYHSGTSGTLNIKFENYEGDTDTFEINLSDNPEFYEEYFTNGALTGELFNVDITDSDLNPVTIYKIVLMMDVEPLV